MDDISHDHPVLPRCKFCYVLAMRSSDIIKGHQNVFFLPLASHRKELQHRAWSHCVLLIKPHRMIYILILRSRWSRDLRSPLDLDMMRSSYSYLDAYQREDLDGAIIFALARLVPRLLTNNSCPQVPHFDVFDPCDVIFTWPKNDLPKHYRFRQPVCNTVYRLSLACFVFDISGGVGYPPIGWSCWGPDPRAYVRGLISYIYPIQCPQWFYEWFSKSFPIFCGALPISDINVLYVVFLDMKLSGPLLVNEVIHWLYLISS